MNAEASTYVAYVVITLLLWGYALHLILAGRRLARQNQSAPAPRRTP